MCPNLPTIKAASPETCGAAMEVPVAKKYRLLFPNFPPGLSTKSKTKQGVLAMGPTWHTAVVGVKTASPPGAATLITDCRSEERRVGKECRSRWSRDD